MAKHRDLAAKAIDTAKQAGVNGSHIPAAIQADIELLQAHIEDMADAGDQARAEDTIARIQRGERTYFEWPTWKYRHKNQAAA